MLQQSNANIKSGKIKFSQNRDHTLQLDIKYSVKVYNWGGQQDSGSIVQGVGLL